ncbi:hypothetical protein G1O98_27000 [Nostoc sp. UIC10630]|nr:hypothetical protein [Nostoc sp. UIC 10630]NEU82594.1 hypothetical protein [Nostoc sp. UIC 10630]
MSPGSSNPVAPADSSPATIGSLFIDPCCSRNFNRGRVNVTFSRCGSGTSCPFASRFAPCRNGGRNTTVVNNRSSVNPVVG